MQRKTKQPFAFLAIMILFMQTLFGSLPAMAIDGNHAISPTVTQTPTTSADSAAITQQATTADSAVIYVKQGASGNGTSWTNAFGDLQAALNEASTKLTAGATSVEIWLAQGTYTPTNEVGGTGNRYKTFQMQNNVSILGGFSGNGTERDWQTYKTILSGDIGTKNDTSDNVYHVFYHPSGLNLNATAILDGVIITGGNANDSVYYSRRDGGGMYNSSNSSPTLTDVMFVSNTAANTGGGMFNTTNSSPTLTNVMFVSNTAGDNGGGMYNTHSSPTLIDVTFDSNTAANREGGGMYNTHSSPTLTNVMFVSNTAGDNGGGVYNDYYSSPTLTNVTMSGNKGTSVIYGGSAKSKIQNSIIAGNDSTPALTYYSGTIANSLLDVMDNWKVLAKFHQSTTDITSDTYTPQDIFIDPNQQNYQLRAGSAAINKGNTSSYQSIINNAPTNEIKEALKTDLVGNPRLQGEAIDLGAYEAFPYHVTYERNGATAGDAPINKMTYQEGDSVTVQGNSGNLMKAGYTFVGWNTQADGTGDDYAENASFTMSAQNQTFYAKWTANAYSVTFESNGGSVVATQQVPYNTPASEPTPPSKQGHTFVGWYKDTALTQTWHFTTDVVTEAITLYAKWTTNTYPVTFESNGGSAVTTQQVPYNTQASEPTPPSKQGHTFVGWYKDTALTQAWHFTTDVVTEAITLYAKWTTNTSPVTFESNGGNAITVQQVPYNTPASEPTPPIKQGHTFVGWYKDAALTQEWNFATDIVTAAITLYAKWTANPTYTVTYDKNGAISGTVPQDNKAYEEKDNVTVQGNSGQLVRTGYTFKGWNTQADGKGTPYAEKATFLMGKTNVTLYAQWTASPPATGGGSNPPAVSNDNDYSPPRKVTITLQTNGGTALQPIEISYNTKTSEIPRPTRAGYRFDGWYQDEALTKRWAEETILRENISLYAKWTALPVEEPESPQEPQPSKPIVTFSDVERHWAKEMIGELAARGIIQGYEDGSFRPNALISRMHVAVLLTRAFSLEPVRQANDFLDVPPTHPYYEAITALQQAGIVDGANGAFLPAENMTRAQLAKVLVGVLGLTPQGTSSFADVDSTHWSAGYIAVLEHEGIALGDQGNFRPNEPITRAQFVAFLYRIMQMER